LRFLNKTSVEKFLTENEIKSGPLDTNKNRLVFELPVAHGKILSTMRLVLNERRRSDWILVVVENAGIWPSWEDRNLYRMMREAKECFLEPAFGEGLLFEASEIQDAISFTTVFANFRWDVRVLDSEQNFEFTISHDDEMTIFIPNASEEFHRALLKTIEPS
jgi:hypothetical protein